MGVTKRMNLRHLVTCRTNILWLMYTARRTNSNEVSNCLFVRCAVPIDADLFVRPAVRIATALYLSHTSNMLQHHSVGLSKVFRRSSKFLHDLVAEIPPT